MTIIQDVIGHSQAVSQIFSAKSSGNLHHAYSIIGGKHLGKETIARLLAQSYLGVSQLETSSDFLYIKREVNKKTGKLKKDISIEQAKNVVHFFSLMGTLQKKVCIIDEAEHLSTSAVNALLKTIEEPKTNGIIFLLVEHDNALPSTIFSRTHNIYLSPVSNKTLIDSKKDIYALDERNRAASVSFGYPGIFLLSLQNSDYLDRREKEIKRFLSFIDKPFSDKLERAEELFGDKSDHLYQRDVINEALDIWLGVLSSTFLDFQYPEIKKIPITQIPHICDTIFVAKRYIRQNIHPRLVIEHILLSIP